ASAAHSARHDKCRSALGARGDCRGRIGTSLFSPAAPRYRFRDLLCRHAYIDFLVAPSLAPVYQFRLPEAMKNPIKSLLEDDHESLGQLLTELDGELANHNFPHAFELLDLFWARLAIHIRAENLHLFPALDNARASL